MDSPNNEKDFSDFLHSIIEHEINNKIQHNVNQSKEDDCER